MEIQEKNNLLQQLFLSRAENTPVVDVSEKGFADMLNLQKSAKSEVAQEADSIIDFKRDNYTKANSSIKDKQDIPVKDSSEIKRKDKKEQTAVSEDNDVKNEVKDNKVKDKKREEGVEAVTTPKEENAALAQQEEEGAVADGENISASMEEMENVADKTVNAVSPDVLLGVLAMPMQSIVADTGGEAAPLSVDENLTSVEEIFVINGAKTDAAPLVSADDATAALLQEGEDAKLLEQAVYIDKKIASQDKIKIEVNIAEDKVEVPVSKDILQNRFEIDSLLQNVDHDETIIQDDLNPDIVLNKEKASSTVKPVGDSLINAFAYKAEMQTAKDVSSRSLSDASNLAISGKEVVFETSNNLRAETFSRLNESSSRDVFKGMGKEVVEQIKINITKSAIKGVDTIDIQLKPEDLGKIQIRMHIAKDGKLHADIISSRPETMDMLQKDISGLQKAFNDAGYDTDSRSFNFSFQKENQTRNGQDSSSDLMQFIGDTLEQEAKDIAGNDNLEYDPILGLNIRV